VVHRPISPGKLTSKSRRLATLPRLAFLEREPEMAGGWGGDQRSNLAVLLAYAERHGTSRGSGVDFTTVKMAVARYGRPVRTTLFASA
jgi:hypothetical protein